MDSVKYQSTLRAHILERQMCTDGKQRWVAFFPDFPNCRAQGETDAEAIRNLYEVYPRYREAMKALGVSDVGLSTGGSSPATMTVRMATTSFATSTGQSGPATAVPA